MANFFPEFPGSGLLNGGHHGVILAESSDCGAPDPGTAHSALGYRIGGLFGILTAALIGFMLPYVLKGQRYNFMFFLFQAFAAGVVAAVGLVHILPDASGALTNPCLGFSDFPWGGMITLFALLFTFIFEHSLTLFMEGQVLAPKGHPGLDGAEPTNMMEKGVTEEEIADARLKQHKVIALTLEVGIIFHSIFVGLSLGTSRDVNYVQGLTFALLFHQGFEGIALGGAVAKAQLSTSKLVIYCVAFILTTPVGIAIGLAVSDQYSSNDKVYLGFEGIVNSIAAGILIYNAVVDLILPAFSRGGDKPMGKIGTILGFASLLFGAGAMTLIANWA